MFNKTEELYILMGRNDRGREWEVETIGFNSRHNLLDQLNGKPVKIKRRVSRASIRRQKKINKLLSV
jgi:hypothetical protein